MMKHKNYFWLWIILLTSGSRTVFADDFADHYRARHYQLIVDAVSKVAGSAAESDLYYAALSYAQLGQVEKAKEIILTLLGMDPSFYAYKLRFDPEIYPVLAAGDMRQVLTQYEVGKLATSSRARHQLVKTAGGLFLYANGLRTSLGDGKDVVYGGFVADDALYFIQSVAPTRRKDTAKSKVQFYSVVRKTPGGIFEVPGTFSSARLTGVSQLVVQTATSYQLFDARLYAPLGPVTTGSYQDPAVPPP